MTPHDEGEKDPQAVVVADGDDAVEGPKDDPGDERQVVEEGGPHAPLADYHVHPCWEIDTWQFLPYWTHIKQTKKSLTQYSFPALWLRGDEGGEEGVAEDGEGDEEQDVENSQQILAPPLLHGARLLNAWREIRIERRWPIDYIEYIMKLSIHNFIFWALEVSDLVKHKLLLYFCRINFH